MAKLVLQIYDENDAPLTLIEVARIVRGITDEAVRETANSTYTESGKDLPKRCDNRNHNLYKKCVGGGICFAKKYKRLDVSVDQVCGSCESKVITDTLNHIFNTYYDGNYTAKWRSTRAKKAARPAKAPKKRGETKKEEQIKALNNIKSEPAKTKPKGRPKKDNPDKVKPKKEKKKKPKVAVPKTRNRTVRGRPGRRLKVEAA